MDIKTQLLEHVLAELVLRDHGARLAGLRDRRPSLRTMLAPPSALRMPAHFLHYQFFRYPKSLEFVLDGIIVSFEDFDGLQDKIKQIASKRLC